MKRMLVLVFCLVLSACIPSKNNRIIQEPQVITMDLTVGITTAEYITSKINIDSVYTFANKSVYSVKLYPCNVVLYINITRNGITSRVVKDLRMIRFMSSITFICDNGVLADVRI